ncbi:hybrid sensor histidine kinase/response regulator [Blastopirellula retiformator]|uniref:histidine kinase n=1 Tax=Blastopirellula retiformator TaxID=2527970 RepID=A0A5C5V8H9_9BACT|nr:response regulator [Blastopirellula retiformator]TWT34320.1 Sensor protein ZraS [Blastopirellula retiformator]
MRVIVADDSTLVRTMLQETLDKAGYEVIAYDNGSDALEAISNGESRLAILDWMMPGYSGLEICQQLRDNRASQWVYAILLTAKDHPDDILRAFEAGASDYVSKPFREAELLARIAVGARMIKLQTELAQAQRLESVGQLAAGIAHEINTPTQYVGDNTIFLKDAFKDLNDTLTQCDELLKAARSGSLTPALMENVEQAWNNADIPYLRDEIPEAIEQTLKGVEQVSKIVRAMKDFSHPGGGAKTMVNLQEAIETTIAVARNEWKYVADIVTQFDENLQEVSCFPGELNQALLNLIVNSTHAIGDKIGDSAEQQGTITVGTRLLDGWAEIFVQDTGAGIPESCRAKIFDPFFTTKPVGKGTGQGLAITYSAIVDKHGGVLDFKSKEGEGTTFFIRLPVSEPCGATL